jgi:prevent-host-death family protein
VSFAVKKVLVFVVKENLLQYPNNDYIQDGIKVIIKTEGGKMSTLNVAKDIIPVGKFKAGLSQYLKSIREHKHSIVITQNGMAAGVLITPEEYDRLTYWDSFRKSAEQGMRDIENGKLMSTEQARSALEGPEK